MSRVYFHTESDEAELYGSERAYAGSVCEGLAMSVASRLPGDWCDKLRDMSNYKGSMEYDYWLRITLFGSCAKRITYKDISAEAFSVMLNTAQLLGSDYVRLLARIHGQCEIHGWIEGPDKSWVADLIAGGRKANLYRPDMGWESVETLLRDNDTEPVVMSYSVCDTFPSPSWILEGEGADLGDYSDNALDDMWGAKDLWPRAVAVLRERCQDSRLDPERWPMMFDDGHTLVTFRDAIRADEKAQKVNAI
jgi:hypothetical protein